VNLSERLADPEIYLRRVVAALVPVAAGRHRERRGGIVPPVHCDGQDVSLPSAQGRGHRGAVFMQIQLERQLARDFGRAAVPPGGQAQDEALALPTLHPVDEVVGFPQEYHAGGAQVELPRYGQQGCGAGDIFHGQCMPPTIIPTPAPRHARRAGVWRALLS